MWVSVVGLGTSGFGRRNMDFNESDRVIREAVDLGINLLDTANSYGPAEEFIGRSMQEFRDKVVVATKVGFRLGDGPNEAGGSRQHLMQQVEASLRRLNTDYIDLYQLHFPDPQTPMEETLRTLDDLVRQGKVRYIGSSNFLAWQVAQAMEISQLLRLEAFVSIQPEYNMLKREVEQELIPCCEAYGLGILPYHPLDAGFLTGKYRRGQPPPEGTRLSFVPQIADSLLTERRFDVVEQLEEFATQRSRSILELAIAWLLAKPVVSSVIAGVSRVGQATENAKAAGWTLSSVEVRELDQIIEQVR